MGDLVTDLKINLKKSIKTGNLDQAKLVLTQLISLPEPDNREVIQTLALAPDKPAFELLSFLATSENKDPEIYPRLIQLIVDRAHLKFNFVSILLDTGDREAVIHAVPLLGHILSNETDRALLGRIIRTAGKLKIDPLTRNIAEFIFYDDNDLKAEAVKALERIGSSRAYEMLDQASKTEKCDPDILDALEFLDGKNSAPRTPSPEQTMDTDDYPDDLKSLTSADINKRFASFLFFSQKGPEVSLALLKHLKTGNHDLIVNILRIITRTIPLGAVNELFSLINQKKIDNTIKFAAYNALEAFPNLKSAASVVQGLLEPAYFVRLAAVKTLDKNLSDFVCAEIKNKIESGTKKGEVLAQTILDAKAKHLIDYLMISDAFSYITSNYLAGPAPIPVLDTFIEILENRNLRSTAGKYKGLRKEKTAQRQEVIVLISSSESILNTYSKLVVGCGFSCLTFRHSQEAFEAIVSQKPCAVICDLFLNDITGIDLAVEVRELYPKEEVPILLSCLQKDLDKSLIQKEMDRAGVTALCEFPATPNQIKSLVKSKATPPAKQGPLL